MESEQITTKSHARLVAYMEVSWNRGTSKSSILVGFSLINQPFGGTTISGNPHMCKNAVLEKMPLKI